MESSFSEEIQTPYFCSSALEDLSEALPGAGESSLAEDPLTASAAPVSGSNLPSTDEETALPSGSALFPEGGASAQLSKTAASSSGSALFFDTPISRLSSGAQSSQSNNSNRSQTRGGDLTSLKEREIFGGAEGLPASADFPAAALGLLGSGGGGVESSLAAALRMNSSLSEGEVRQVLIVPSPQTAQLRALGEDASLMQSVPTHSGAPSPHPQRAAPSLESAALSFPLNPWAFAESSAKSAKREDAPSEKVLQPAPPQWLPASAEEKTQNSHSAAAALLQEPPLSHSAPSEPSSLLRAALETPSAQPPSVAASRSGSQASPRVEEDPPSLAALLCASGMSPPQSPPPQGEGLARCASSSGEPRRVRQPQTQAPLLGFGSPCPQQQQQPHQQQQQQAMAGLEQALASSRLTSGEAEASAAPPAPRSPDGACEEEAIFRGFEANGVRLPAAEEGAVPGCMHSEKEAAAPCPPRARALTAAFASPFLAPPLMPEGDAAPLRARAKTALPSAFVSAAAARIPPQPPSAGTAPSTTTPPQNAAPSPLPRAPRGAAENNFFQQPRMQRSHSVSLPPGNSDPQQQRPAVTPPSRSQTEAFLGEAFARLRGSASLPFGMTSFDSAHCAAALSAHPAATHGLSGGGSEVPPGFLPAAPEFLLNGGAGICEEAAEDCEAQGVFAADSTEAALRVYAQQQTGGAGFFEVSLLESQGQALAASAHAQQEALAAAAASRRAASVTPFPQKCFPNSQSFFPAKAKRGLGLAAATAFRGEDFEDAAGNPAQQQQQAEAVVEDTSFFLDEGVAAAASVGSSFPPENFWSGAVWPPFSQQGPAARDVSEEEILLKEQWRLLQQMEIRQREQAQFQVFLEARQQQLLRQRIQQQQEKQRLLLAAQSSTPVPSGPSSAAACSWGSQPLPQESSPPLDLWKNGVPDTQAVEPATASLGEETAAAERERAAQRQTAAGVASASPAPPFSSVRVRTSSWKAGARAKSRLPMTSSSFAAKPPPSRRRGRKQESSWPESASGEVEVQNCSCCDNCGACLACGAMNAAVPNSSSSRRSRASSPISVCCCEALCAASAACCCVCHCEVCCCTATTAAAAPAAASPYLCQSFVTATSVCCCCRGGSAHGHLNPATTPAGAEPEEEGVASSAEGRDAEWESDGDGCCGASRSRVEAPGNAALLAFDDEEQPQSAFLCCANRRGSQGASAVAAPQRAPSGNGGGSASSAREDKTRSCFARCVSGLCCGAGGENAGVAIEKMAERTESPISTAARPEEEEATGAAADDFQAEFEKSASFVFSPDGAERGRPPLRTSPTEFETQLLEQQRLQQRRLQQLLERQLLQQQAIEAQRAEQLRLRREQLELQRQQRLQQIYRFAVDPCSVVVEVSFNETSPTATPQVAQHQQLQKQPSPAATAAREEEPMVVATAGTPTRPGRDGALSPPRSSSQLQLLRQELRSLQPQSLVRLRDPRVVHWLSLLPADRTTPLLVCSCSEDGSQGGETTAERVAETLRQCGFEAVCCVSNAELAEWASSLVQAFKTRAATQGGGAFCRQSSTPRCASPPVAQRSSGASLKEGLLRRRPQPPRKAGGPVAAAVFGPATATGHSHRVFFHSIQPPLPPHAALCCCTPRGFCCRAAAEFSSLHRERINSHGKTEMRCCGGCPIRGSAAPGAAAASRRTAEGIHSS